MKNLHSLNKIQKELEFCDNYWAVLYGSQVQEEIIPGRSDIDVAIITQDKNKQSNLTIWRGFFEHVSPPYDLKIFELLPLYLQNETIKNYRVIFGDPLEISEYFYHYWKIWKAMVTRVNANQFSGIREKLDLLAQRERVMKL